MVGVPGRSKGCNTCIKRKIKCDQETPSCGNCRRSNRLCTGYKRRLGYVISNETSLVGPVDLGSGQTTVIHQGRWRKDTGQGQPHKPDRPSKLQWQPSENFVRPEPTEQSQDLVWIGGTRRETSVGRSSVNGSRCGSEEALGPHVSIGRLLREQFHTVFLYSHLPADMLEVGRPEAAPVGNWMFDLQGLVVESPGLEAALAAFFGSRIGRKNGDMTLVTQSLALYTRGIEGLQGALRDPRTRLSDETLATCIALSLYEVAERRPGRATAYASHQKAAMMLLQLRGPDASASGLGHSLFLTIRVQEILGNVGRTHSIDTFLSTPDWMTRPWRLSSKTVLDELLDSLFGFFALNSHCDDLEREQNQTARLAAFYKAIQGYLDIETTLDALYDKFEKSVSGPLYWPELSTLDTRADDGKVGKLYPVSFYFPAFFVGQTVNTYWSCMMAVHARLTYIWSKIGELESAVPTSARKPYASLAAAAAASDSDARLEEHDAKWKAMARNLCQSAEYFMQDSMGGLGLLALLTFLRGFQSCMENAPGDWSREADWLSEVMGRTLRKFDFPINTLLGD